MGNHSARFNINISCYRDRILKGIKAETVLRTKINESDIPKIVPADKNKAISEMLSSSSMLLGEEDNNVYLSAVQREMKEMNFHDFLLSFDVQANTEYLKDFLNNVI